MRRPGQRAASGRGRDAGASGTRTGAGSNVGARASEHPADNAGEHTAGDAAERTALDSQTAVRRAAVALLARRDFAVRELADRLKADGHSDAAVAAVVAELAAGGILDDARFAAQFVSYHAERGQGPWRIAQELKGRGVLEAVIDAALAAGPDWPARAREARIRRFGLPLPATWPEKARQARFLQYRGFSSDHIRSAIGPDFDSDEPS